MIAQQLLNGLIVGGVYALFALGFNLIFGIHRILNLAHGAIFMAGAFFGLYAVEAGLPFWLAFLVAMAGAGLLAVLVDYIAFRPLRGRGDVEFAAIISSIGVDLLLVSIAQRVSETQVLRFPFGTFPIETMKVMGLRINLLQILIVVLVLVLAGLLALYLYRTSFGRQVRAVAANPRAAGLLGVDAGQIFRQTFFLSGALAGAAGVLIGLAFNSIHFLMGEPYLLRGFVVLILGGLGSLPGALVGGLVLGLLQTLATAYLPSGLSDAVIYALLFVILLVRPTGLFGTALADTRVYRR